MLGQLHALKGLLSERVFVWQEDLPERFAALIADPPADIGACRTKALIWMPVRELARYSITPSACLCILIAM